jgi:hypothetical protein
MSPFFPGWLLMKSLNSHIFTSSQFWITRITKKWVIKSLGTPRIGWLILNMCPLVN